MGKSNSKAIKKKIQQIHDECMNKNSYLGVYEKLMEHHLKFLEYIEKENLNQSGDKVWSILFKILIQIRTEKTTSGSPLNKVLKEKPEHESFVIKPQTEIKLLFIENIFEFDSFFEKNTALVLPGSIKIGQKYKLGLESLVRKKK
jgi:hypothetical protein